MKINLERYIYLNLVVGTIKGTFSVVICVEQGEEISLCTKCTYMYSIIDRSDQGHLCPLGEHPGGQLLRLPPPGIEPYPTLYLKSYLDSLYADYSEPLQYNIFV
jgi:hypothetical protein